MSSNNVQCEYLNGNLCNAITDEEAKAVRKKSCTNDPKNLCCYLCEDRKSCEISCAYLDKPGESSVNEAEDLSGRYLGGDDAYRKQLDVTLSLYSDDLVIDEMDLRIPYSSIKQVSNVNQQDIEALPGLLLGNLGAMWTRDEPCLCIAYADEGRTHTLVFRMNYPEDAQNAIYDRVLESARKKGKGKEPNFIVCAYCRARYDANENFKCPNCGGINS